MAQQSKHVAHEIRLYRVVTRSGIPIILDIECPVRMSEGESRMLIRRRFASHRTVRSVARITAEQVYE